VVGPHGCRHPVGAVLADRRRQEERAPQPIRGLGPAGSRC